ncbi:hypothetical protein LCGC14_2645920 [marine sediment metagenome]|uniref:Uncharacterized protein n=1 Tax=marine sediment metagenome TaxID=412755 RepID=A0A0F9C6P3_9ZZZZ
MGMAEPKDVPRETIPIAHSSCCPHCEPHMALVEKLITLMEQFIREVRETDRTLEKILKAVKR